MRQGAGREGEERRNRKECDRQLGGREGEVGRKEERGVTVHLEGEKER